MVGKPETDGPDDTAPLTPSPTSKTPTAKTFSCPSCGGAVTIRCPGESISAVCGSCFSIIDTQDENYSILQRHFAKTSLYKPQIPFGTRALLRGKKWECIGFVVRKDADSAYKWEEYLLFNPYYGYRWLTCNNGHWSLVTMIKSTPVVDLRSASLDKRNHKLFFRGRATYVFVLGEFYWKVQTGGIVSIEDFIAPPFMLSMERDNNEIVWSIGEYIPKGEVEKQFKIKAGATKGVAPNQPSGTSKASKQLTPVWMLFIGVFTVLQLIHTASCANKQIFQKGYSFVTNMKVVDLTTPPFKVEKPSGNLSISLYAPVDNDWLYMDGELVDNKTGETYPLEESVEYYHGYSDGESWSEGGQTASVVLSKVPAGEYYINMDLLSGAFPKTGVQTGSTLSVVSDVPQWGNYFWCLFFISIAPSIAWLMSYGTEKARWSESDFAPSIYRSES